FQLSAAERKRVFPRGAASPGSRKTRFRSRLRYLLARFVSRRGWGVVVEEGAQCAKKLAAGGSRRASAGALVACGAEAAGPLVAVEAGAPSFELFERGRTLDNQTFPPGLDAFEALCLLSIDLAARSKKSADGLQIDVAHE